VAELLGDYTLVPALAVVALAAYAIDRLVDLVTRSRPSDKVHDEDA